MKRFDLNAARLMYEVNVLSLAWLAQSLLPAMQERGWGRVVAVGSTCSLHGYPYVAGYAASKHALAGWVRSAAREVAASGVTVNVLCPGYLDTEMTAATIAGIVASTGKNPADVRKTLESLSPQQRIFSPDEVASTALFLCSDGARGVNGQAIAICGGENT